MTFAEIVEDIGRVIDAIGVLAIAFGIVVVGVLALTGIRRGTGDPYEDFRHRLGRVILLGLELLVAADIIRTVAVTPTLESVGVLAGIVIVRTFLSFSLEVELNGRWPWDRSGREPSS